MSFAGPLIIVVATVVLTELLAAWVHEHVMHGWGWGWHRSHHEPNEGFFEKNDLYTVVFAAFSVVLFTLGSMLFSALWWVGVGLCVYGVLYYIVHDGLVHQRWPFRVVPKSGYLRRLYQAHKLHHAAEGKEGAVSFGFLFARPVTTLSQELKANRRGLERSR